VKLVADMNLSPRWLALLAGAGLEAVHWSTIGAMNATDAHIMVPVFDSRLAAAIGHPTAATTSRASDSPALGWCGAGDRQESDPRSIQC
jgi:hypothetical protein